MKCSRFLAGDMPWNGVHYASEYLFATYKMNFWSSFREVRHTRHTELLISSLEKRQANVTRRRRRRHRR